MQKFTQCTMSKANVDGSTSYQVSFIPEEKAIKDHYLKLKNLDGSWTDGWKVDSTGITLSEDQLVIQRDAYRTHRDGTDI